MSTILIATACVAVFSTWLLRRAPLQSAPARRTPTPPTTTIRPVLGHRAASGPVRRESRRVERRRNDQRRIAFRIDSRGDRRHYAERRGGPDLWGDRIAH